MAHNEVMNVWTHLFGLFLFIAISIWLMSAGTLGETFGGSVNFTPSNAFKGYMQRVLDKLPEIEKM